MLGGRDRGFASIKKGRDMAAKIKCPNCGSILKEMGDTTKEASGEYIVYDSLQNSEMKRGDVRIIECCLCDYAGRSENWIEE